MWGTVIKVIFTSILGSIWSWGIAKLRKPVEERLGAAEALVNQQAEVIKQVEVANEIHNKNAMADDASIHQQLHSNWLRH